MSKSTVAPRRVRVERNIYQRPTGTFEVGFKDAAGVQRWRTVDGGLMAARRLRDDLLARRGRGERVAPNPRLRFGDAADRWLAGQVTDLRQSTQYGYRNAVEQHLRPRYATRRLDAIGPDDFARLVREMRAAGKSEATIAVVIGVAGRIYKYAARRLGWAGTSPTTLMLGTERPKVSQAKKRPIYTGQQLEQTVAAAHDPFKTMFLLAALTGARLSELCGLTWENVRIKDLEDAEIEFGWQVDRHGVRQPTKTDGSARTIPIPRSLAVILAQYWLKAAASDPDAYVFATRTGRPLAQRNVARALRKAQRAAADDLGRPTFPVLQEKDEKGRFRSPKRGELPSMHSFRHTVASRALLAGESIDEVAFLLGHRDANVTRSVYLREVNDARRRMARRSKIEEEYKDVLKVGAA